MDFFEIEFPTDISYLAVGGPGFSTQPNKGFSGFEQRNRNWALSLGEWNVSLLTPSKFDGNRQGFIDLLMAFFLNAGGMADAFRLKDHKDFKGTNQLLATVNGHVQLVKLYTIGGRSYQRVIKKPITSAINDYQGNALPNTVFLHGTNTPVTVDATTGIVTGQSAGTAVDFQFHYPARFDVDKLAIRLEESDVAGGNPIASWESIPLIEVRI